MDDSGSEDESRKVLMRSLCDSDIAKLPVYIAGQQPSCLNASHGGAGITYVDAFEDTVLDNISSHVEDCSNSNSEDYDDDDDVDSREALADTADASYYSLLETSCCKPMSNDQPVEDWDAEIESAHPYGLPTPYVHKDHQQPKYNRFTYGKATSFPKLLPKKVRSVAGDVCEGQFDDA